jgi:hypothetical protein
MSILFKAKIKAGNKKDLILELEHIEKLIADGFPSSEDWEIIGEEEKELPFIKFEDGEEDDEMGYADHLEEIKRD